MPKKPDDYYLSKRDSLAPDLTKELEEINARTRSGNPLITRYTKGSGGQIGPKILKEQNLGVKEWIEKGIWAVVISSNVSSIRYLAKTQQLLVMFASRKGRARLYIYEQVPNDIAERYFLSPSLGKFTHDRLIGSFVSRRIIL